MILHTGNMVPKATPKKGVQSRLRCEFPEQSGSIEDYSIGSTPLVQAIPDTKL